MFINLMLLVFLIVRLVTAVRLVVLARRSRQANMYWLAAQLFAVAIGLIFTPIPENPLGGQSVTNYFIFTISIPVAQLASILFIQTTFYRDRKSPLWWYVGAFVVGSFIALYFMTQGEIGVPHPLAAFVHASTVLTSFWQVQSANRALADISEVRDVEDWIKARYRLVTAYSICLIISGAANFARDYFAGGAVTNPLGGAMALLSLPLEITAVVIQFLAWVMPAGFRKWLNRNYQPPAHGGAELGLSEEKIMRQLRS
jgi:hypothetical protein